MAGPGRETKYDERRAKAILTSLRAGNTRKCSAERSGISDRALRLWLAKGKRGIEPFASFGSAVKKAERESEAALIKGIKTAGKKQWTAYAWLVERRFREDWSANRHEIRQLQKQVMELVAALKSHHEPRRKRKATDPTRPTTDKDRPGG